MGNIDAIVSKLARKRSELAQLEKKRQVLMVEIGTYEDALRLLGSDQAVYDSQSSASRRRSSVPSKRRRGLSGGWQKIIRTLATDYASGFNYDDLTLVGEYVDHPVRRNTARSQMAIYAGDGYVEKIDDGIFTVTATGREAVGLEPNEEEPLGAPTPSGSKSLSESTNTFSSSVDSTLRGKLLSGTALPSSAIATTERR